MNLRHAQTTDFPAILAILNQAIAAETIAIIDPVTLEDREQWFAEHTADRYPILVAEEGEELLGWCSLSAYRPGRRALSHVAEISYFVHVSHRRQGVATCLIREMIALAPELGYDTLVALLTAENHANIRLLKGFGFAEWGHLPELINFNGRRVGHLYYGLRVG